MTKSYADCSFSDLAIQQIDNAAIDAQRAILFCFGWYRDILIAIWTGDGNLCEPTKIIDGISTGVATQLKWMGSNDRNFLEQANIYIYIYIYIYVFSLHCCA